MKKIFFCLIGIAACCFIGLPVAGAYTFTDSFSGSAINGTYWKVNTDGGNTVSLTGGRIVMTQSSYAGTSSLSFQPSISGDFVATVDFALLTWPEYNYERVGLSAGGIGSAVVERSQHYGWFYEAYLTHFGNGVITTGTSDLTGTLRLARTGNTITGSFWNGTGWTTISSYTCLTTDATISLAIWNGYVDKEVTVAFDNFTLTAAGSSAVPLPAGILLLAPGLLGLGALRKRSRQ